MIDARACLRDTIAVETGEPIPEAPAALVDAILRRHGGAVAAVIFHGSCLRRIDPTAADDPVHDFYVLVESYHAFYGNPALMLANRLLPPNVFYIEVPWRGRRLRAKYSILSLPHFCHLLSPRAFHSYFWARFSQPARIAYSRDDGARATLVDALAGAVVTLLSRVTGLMPDEFEPADLWLRAFTESYRAELRAEGADRARLIYQADAIRYDRLAELVLSASDVAVRADAGNRRRIGSPASARRLAGLSWVLRRGVGKILSVLRIAKGAFTFDGGLDYVLWKIERHSGVSATVTAWQRRHPLLAAPALAWRLYRRGAFR